jgi:mRNA-degrading endonuclease toxin of MazEF toxin-antitoxin module
MIQSFGGEFLRTSEIKVGYIYYVDYEPVRNCEFGGLHLSVVLKKNNDKTTFVVVPLTSSSNGEGANKVNLGKIFGLPPNLSKNDSYAVYNQIRTVNSNRFRAVTHKRKTVNASISNNAMQRLYDLIIGDILFNVDKVDKISILKNAFERELLNKAIDIAYDIIKLRKLGAGEEKITELKVRIKETLNDAPRTMGATQITDDIRNIFDESLNA